ncbi:hypothetical protein [Thermosipho melanesiensis]|uniref:hypothetical protein n=1 Tax=Thermosipho melanesiensis TaxID=46541 RepID=UPI0015D66AD0|nr:hypothetical protein [Thermosipho melanesiensis]
MKQLNSISTRQKDSFLEEAIADFIFKNTLLSMNLNRLSTNVLKEIKQCFDNAQTGNKSWKIQMYVLGTKQNLLSSIYYTLSQ